MTRPRYTVLKRHARPLIAACAVLGVGVLAWSYTVDDAFIVARYARHIAAGQGYAMNPPQISDGVTGPLWLLPQVLACYLGCDLIAVAKALGLLCAALSAWLVVARLQARSALRPAATAATIVLALSPSLGTWGASGLETGAATLLATLAGLSATRRPSPAGALLGCCIAGLAWLRPELALFAALLLLWVCVRDARAGVVASSLALLGLASIVGFRWSMFGTLLPLSFHAKAGTLADGLAYATYALVLSTSLVGAVLALFGALRGRPDDRALGVALVVHLGALCLAGGDWMPGYRLLVPVLPLYAALVGIGFVRLRTNKIALRVLLLLLACSIPAIDLATRVPELRAAGASQERLHALAVFLRANARVVALVDVGYLGFMSDVEVIDLGGITDAQIASLPGGHLAKRVTPQIVQARQPDAILLHSATAPRVAEDGRLLAFEGFPVEQRVAIMPSVRNGFRVAHIHSHAPHYYYAVLLRRDAIDAAH